MDTQIDLSRALFGTSRVLLDKSRLRGWLDQARVQAAALTSADAIQAAMKRFAQRQIGPQMVGDTAVINACGPITYRATWFSMFFGGATIEDLQQQLRMALNDPAVRTIAFRWNSPGGCVDMVPEFADELFASRGKKPILSMADTDICSAAYWLASQTNAIYASASSVIGSIGVWTEHDDISGMLDKAGIKITLISHGAHKVDGNPYEPLSDAVRADIQKDVDEIGDDFEKAVARGRGVTQKTVIDRFGGGKCFKGKEAISLGLADKPGTFGQVLTRLGKANTATVPAAVRADDVPMDDDDGPISPVDVTLYVT